MTTTSTGKTPAVVERDAQPYAAMRRQVTMAQMGEVLPPLIDEVFAWLTAHGGQPAGPPFWRYRVINMAALLDIEVGVATTDLVEPEGEVVTGMLPAGRYASVEHTGHPDSLMAATRELLDWADEEGLVFDHVEQDDGDHWECRLELYLTDPADEPDLNEWVTELAFKLAD
ncbi:MAG TPA: GyrI-like domain-containing protein [Propionibacteriaceae bacterium]|nr:GyrI-like domain-containing protein [Propionibacteriaceae bacterium]